MKKILIYNSGGGIGDTVQIINLLISLHEHYNDHEIYLLQAHQNNLFEESLKELNLNFIKKSAIELMYFGFRIKHYFQLNSLIERNNIFFDIIIDLQSKLRNTIILKKIPHNIFISSTFNNFFLKPKIKINNKEKNIIYRISNYINILNNEKFMQDNKNSPTWKSVSVYFDIRKAMANELMKRDVKSINAKANIDVRFAYDAVVSKLKKDDPLGFAYLYDRFLSQDLILDKNLTPVTTEKGTK